MALTLTITDNANGTATFTIADSGGDDVNVFGCTPGAAWSVVASRTGDGTATATLASGNYFFYARNADSGEVTDVATRKRILDLTTADAAIHYQCLLAVQGRLQDLTLDGLDSANIVTQKVFKTTSLEKDGASAPTKLPGIQITPAGQEKLAGGTNGRDDIGYPVAVVILAKDEKDLTANLAQYTRWREQCIAAFINQRLTDVSEIHLAAIEPAPIIPREAWNAGWLASAFTIRFFARRTRGVI